MDAAVRFANVRKCFGRQEVLRGLTLTINPGEFLGLVGANGAGKTTLFKCLLNFCDVDSGTIEIFGVEHTSTKARSRLAFLPESFVPPSFVTGREFIRYMTKLHGQHYQPPAVEVMLTVLDLDPNALSKPVRELSKGMAQKLGLVATLLSGKDLLVLDEPMSGLDPKSRAMAMRHLIEQKRLGRTLFFSTHTLTDVGALCDRMAILHAGELRYVGTPSDCCARFGAADLEEAYMRLVTV